MIQDTCSLTATVETQVAFHADFLSCILAWGGLLPFSHIHSIPILHVPSVACFNTFTALGPAVTCEMH